MGWSQRLPAAEKGVWGGQALRSLVGIFQPPSVRTAAVAESSCSHGRGPCLPWPFAFPNLKKPGSTDKCCQGSGRKTRPTARRGVSLGAWETQGIPAARRELVPAHCYPSMCQPSRGLSREVSDEGSDALSLFIEIFSKVDLTAEIGGSGSQPCTVYSL